MFNPNLIIISLILIYGVSNLEISGQSSETLLNIDSVSIIDDSHIAIGWTFESDVEDGYFVIHRRTDNIYDSIAAIDDFGIDFFVDTNVNISQKPYSYYISARKLKEDGSYESFASSKAHQTIFMENLAYDICKEAISVRWFNYVITTTVGIPDTLDMPFDSTILWILTDDTTFKIADTLPVQKDHIEIPAAKPAEYCFKLQSFDSQDPSHTTTSNIRCITTTILEPPEYAYLRKASVINNEFLRLYLYADNTISNPAYVIYRATGQNEEFLPVDTVNSGKANITYDDDANIFSSLHKYYFEVLDSCRRPAKSSNTVSSLFLYAEPVSVNENYLQWNLQLGFHGGVDHFIVRRKTGINGKFETIAQLPGNQNHYNDIFSVNGSDLTYHEFIYKIKAVEASQNPFGFKDTVISNHAMAERDVEIFIPNAFKPGSTIEKNRVFKPVIRNAIPEKYRMIIYNYWGQVVFTTEDHNDHWDGNINGKQGPSGVYLYEISFSTGNGKTHNKKGTVKVIR